MWLLWVGLISPLVVSTITTNNQVPPQFRADRWELSRDGQHARQRTEEQCGPLPSGCWIDMTEQDVQPIIYGASAELEQCFVNEIAPRFQRGRPVDL